MKRLHVSLIVDDFDASKQFYSTLFAMGPSVERLDYAKWMVEDPRVNFSIVDGRARGKGEFGIEHLGIQAETPAELAELRQRISLTRGPVDDEGEVTCCYHQSDKTWVEDGQGVAWEAFHTTAEAAAFDGEAEAETDCCQPSDAASNATAGEASCCGPECCAPIAG
jgi:catechol 2,3-dioxygenase-like lactoylglutathione lyase family enzyme